MSRVYSGEDHCVRCKKFAELDAHELCTLCYNAEKSSIESCTECGHKLSDQENYCDACNPPEPDEDEDPRDDRGDGDFNERGGYTRSYIDSLNKDFR